MRILPKPVAVVLGGTVASVLSAITLGRARWDRATRRAAGLMAESSLDRPSPEITREEMTGLPDPVGRYFRFALAAHQRRIRSARVTHRGEFQVSRGKWSGFTSVEYFSVDPPGFVWEAHIRMAPLLSVLVRDSYLEGAGTTQANAGGVWTMMERHGSRDLSQAALQRWLGEAAWTPTGLLPAAGVRWDPIDDRSARATITDHGIEASLDFEFDAGGAMLRCSGDRYRDSTSGRARWEGTFEEYTRVDGMMIPTSGEAAWLDDGGRAPYWRGRIRRVNYDAG